MNTIQNWLTATRPTLWLTSIAGVSVGTAMAISKGQPFIPQVTLYSAIFSFLMLLVAILAYEYFEYRRSEKRATITGRHHSKTKNQLNPKTLLNVIIILTVMACLVGLLLIPFFSWKIIPVGLVIIAVAYLYGAGPKPLSYIGLGDFVVIVFMGIVPVAMSALMHGLPLDYDVISSGIAIGLMADNVLIVHNYKNFDRDIAKQKYTTVVLLGKTFVSKAYLFSGLIAIAILIKYWTSGVSFYISVVSPLIYIVMHYLAYNRLLSFSSDNLDKVEAQTVANLMAFTLTYSLVLIIIVWKYV